MPSLLEIALSLDSFPSVNLTDVGFFFIVIQTTTMYLKFSIGVIQ